jgi:hypothetical protein
LRLVVEGCAYERLHAVLAYEFSRATTYVRLVNSLGLGKQPSIEPLRRRLARTPGVRCKLDAEASWSMDLIDAVAATGAVDTLDFKGQGRRPTLTREPRPHVARRPA